MAVAISHAAVVVVPDDPTFPVGSDEWNAPHVITGGLDTAVLFDDAGAIGEDPNFTFDKTTDTLTVPNIVGVSGIALTIGSDDELALAAIGRIAIQSDTDIKMTGALQVVDAATFDTRAGTPATMAAFTSAGVLTETTLAQPIAWVMA